MPDGFNWDSLGATVAADGASTDAVNWDAFGSVVGPAAPAPIGPQNVLGAMIQGARQGWGPTQSPETIAANQRADQDLGALAPIAKGINFLSDNAGRPLSAAFRAAQAGIAQTGAELGAPQLGRDIAALPEAFGGMAGGLGVPREAPVVAGDPLPPGASGPAPLRLGGPEPTMGPAAPAPQPAGGPPRPGGGPRIEPTISTPPAVPSPFDALGTIVDQVPPSVGQVPLPAPEPEPAPPQPAPAKAKPGDKITFLDQNGSNHVTGELVSTRSDGRHVVDLGDGPRVFVRPAAVVSGRTLDAAPETPEVEVGSALDGAESAQPEPEEAAGGEALGLGDLWRMPPDQLEAMHVEAQMGDREKLVKALGSDAAAREFTRLDRKQNDPYDTKQADEGAKEFAAKFGNLTAEQERLIYGIGETGPQHDSIKEVLDAHRNRTDNPEDAGYEAAVAIRRVPAAEILAVPGGNASPTAQAAYVRMSNAIEDMMNAGLSSNDIAKTMSSALVTRGGWKPGDAAEIVGDFVEKMKAKAGPGRPKTEPKKVTAPLALPSPGANQGNEATPQTPAAPASESPPKEFTSIKSFEPEYQRIKQDYQDGKATDAEYLAARKMRAGLRAGPDVGKPDQEDIRQTNEPPRGLTREGYDGWAKQQQINYIQDQRAHYQKMAGGWVDPREAKLPLVMRTPAGYPEQRLKELDEMEANPAPTGQFLLDFAYGQYLERTSGNGETEGKAALPPEQAAPDEDEEAAINKQIDAEEAVYRAQYGGVKPGEVLWTKSGRQITVPKFSARNRIQLARWLVSEAQKETPPASETRWVADAIRDLDPKNMSQDDADLARETLFGDPRGPIPQNRVAPNETASATAPARDSVGRAAGSWIVTEKSTGKPVMETFEKKTAGAINKDKFNVVPALDYLAGLTKKAAEPAPPPSVPALSPSKAFTTTIKNPSAKSHEIAAATAKEQFQIQKKIDIAQREGKTERIAALKALYVEVRKIGDAAHESKPINSTAAFGVRRD